MKTIVIMLIMVALLLAIFPIVTVQGTNIIGFYDDPEVTSLLQHVTIGDTFNTTIYVTVVSEIDTAAVDNMTFTPRRISWSGLTKGDLFRSTTIWLEPEVDGTVDNVTGYAQPVLWTYTIGVNTTIGALATIEWFAIGVGIGYINITEGGTAKNGVDNGTNWLNATIYIHPDGPSSYSATGYAWDQNNLMFTPGIGGDNTVVIAKQGSYPTDRDDGTEIYNGSDDHYKHSGLSERDTWYYTFWSWNETENMFSLSYGSDYATTPATTIPLPSTPRPPPSLVTFVRPELSPTNFPVIPVIFTITIITSFIIILVYYLLRKSLK